MSKTMQLIPRSRTSASERFPVEREHKISPHGGVGKRCKRAYFQTEDVKRKRAETALTTFWGGPLSEEDLLVEEMNTYLIIDDKRNRKGLEPSWDGLLRDFDLDVSLMDFVYSTNSSRAVSPMR